MNYKSMAPHLNCSCYNCRFFQISEDMLNGTCHSTPQAGGKSSIGIGTCDRFTAKLDSNFSWSRLLQSNSSATSKVLTS